jgi:hypothetical protein
MLYPAGPPTVEQIVGVMRHAHDHPHGWRLRAMIVMLRRGGLRVQEALASSTHGTSKAGSGGAPHEAQDLPPGQRRPVAR